MVRAKGVIRIRWDPAMVFTSLVPRSMAVQSGTPANRGCRERHYITVATNMFRLSIAYSSTGIRGWRSSDIDVFGVGVGIGIETGSPFSSSIPIPIPIPTLMIPPFSDTVTRHQSERNS